MTESKAIKRNSKGKSNSNGNNTGKNFERVTDEEIQGINQLARKAKSSSGLTKEEAEEQKILRRKYIDSFKANLRNHLDMIKK